METILIKALQLIVALALLIILHEGGHFFAAKLFKVRVEKFYLFFDWKFSIFSTYSNWWRKLMGKAPVKKKENGSYGIGWIPLGGYVAISGMVDESSFKEDGSQKSFWKQLPQLLKNIIIKNSDVKGEPWEFRTHPAWQRLIIMLGGIIMNFITAFVIYAMVLFTWGESFVKSEDMSYGMKFSEQAKADGFQDGDIIIKTDDEVIESWSTSVLQEMSNAKTVTVLRENPEAKDGARQEVVINMPEELSLLDMIEPPLYASMRAPLQIDSILPGTPAEDMGLKKTDKICSVNGIAVEDFNDFQNSLIALQKALPENANFGDSLKARQITLVLNDSVTKQVTLTPEFTLGFANAMPYQDKITTKTYGFFESFPAGFRYGMQTLASYVDQMKYVFTKKGARQVGGFISIGKIFPDAWNWQKFWLLTAFLSIAHPSPRRWSCPLRHLRAPDRQASQRQLPARGAIFRHVSVVGHHGAGTDERHTETF